MQGVVCRLQGMVCWMWITQHSLTWQNVRMTSLCQWTMTAWAQQRLYWSVWSSGIKLSIPLSASYILQPMPCAFKLHNAPRKLHHTPMPRKIGNTLHKIRWWRCNEHLFMLKRLKRWKGSEQKSYMQDNHVWDWFQDLSNWSLNVCWLSYWLQFGNVDSSEFVWMLECWKLLTGQFPMHFAFPMQF